MEVKDFFLLIKKRKGTIFNFVLAFLIIAAAITFSQPLKYQASTRLLIVQDNKDADPYTISKSNQYLGDLFSQVVYSGTFFDLVTNSSFDVDKTYFSGEYKNQIKLWKKTVSAVSNSDTGIIEIDTYQPNPYQANQLALAVNDVLINKNYIFQGSNSNIKINVIDPPTVSTFPVKPNIPLNLGAALILGFFSGLIYVYLVPVSKKKRRQNELLQELRQQIATERAFEASPVIQNETHTNEAYDNEVYDREVPDDIKADSKKINFSGNINNITQL
jgi:capsular polysaccharide biosynthesis protein